GRRPLLASLAGRTPGPLRARRAGHAPDRRVQRAGPVPDDRRPPPGAPAVRGPHEHGLAVPAPRAHRPRPHAPRRHRPPPAGGPPAAARSPVAPRPVLVTARYRSGTWR